MRKTGCSHSLPLCWEQACSYLEFCFHAHQSSIRPTPHPCAGNMHIFPFNLFNAHQSSIHPTPHLVQGTCTFFLLIFLIASVIHSPHSPPCAGNMHIFPFNLFNAHQSSIHPTPHLVQGTCTFFLLIFLMHISHPFTPLPTLCREHAHFYF